MKEYPNFFKELLINQYGENLSKKIIEGYTEKKTTLRVNTLKDNIENIKLELKNENIGVENEANKTHYEVGKEIRNTIEKLGGTMPEELPTPDKSLKELEKENKFENNLIK